MTEKLDKNQSHYKQCHNRWKERRNRKQEDTNYIDSWYGEQCGMCKYFIPLSGVFMEDYGACSNAVSKFDGIVRFEHDGCDVFSDSGEW